MTARPLIVFFGLITAFTIGFGAGFDNGRSAMPPPGTAPTRPAVYVEADPMPGPFQGQSEQERIINHFLFLDGTCTAPYVVEHPWPASDPPEEVEL